MKKFKLFLENFLVYGFGGIISKVVPLLMLPVVTRLLPDSMYFGISDMANTILSFASAVAVMGMYDAMYRMFFEKEEETYKKSICSTALGFTLCTSLVVFLLLLFLKDWVAERFLGGVQNAYLVYITATATLVGATNSILSAPVRMQNKRKLFLVMNTISPVLAYSLAILLLLNGHYILAMPLAAAVSGIVTALSFGVLNRKWFHRKYINVHYLRPMLAIGIPLLPNFLVYWVFNSCDKLMITDLLGLSATGIYSVGAKLGHASQLIYTAFAGGWQYFAFSTMKEADQVQTNSRIFEYLGLVSFAASAFVCVLSRPLYDMLFAGEYVQGYIVAPYLFLAPLLQMLFQVAGNQFLVVKKTWPNILILSVGAAANLLLNRWLIPRIGIEGAALATLAGYGISNVLGLVCLRRMKLMEVSGRFGLACLATSFFFILWRLWLTDNMEMGAAAAIFLTGILVWMYRDDIRGMWQMIKGEAGKEKL